MIQKRNSFWKGVIMLKLLFITHSGSCRPPMAEFIMKSLIARSGQDDKIYASSAHLQKKKGKPLGQKERELLTKKEIPYTEKICPPLTWFDYDRYDYIFLTDDEEKWPFLKIIGGDPKEKVRLLGEYAGIMGNIVNPEKTGQYEEACTASLAACQGLFEKLLDWVAVKTEQS